MQVLQSGESTKKTREDYQNYQGEPGYRITTKNDNDGSWTSEKVTEICQVCADNFIKIQSVMSTHGLITASRSETRYTVPIQEEVEEQ